MSKIIRTPTKATGGITPEEKLALDAHAKKWIANALQTGRTDKKKLTAAIKDLYRVSGLDEPVVIIVPSPIAMAFSYGASAAIWYNHKHSVTGSTTRTAKVAATEAAELAAEYAATDATPAAIAGAAELAIYAATFDSTQAKHDVTYGATNGAIGDAIAAATYKPTVKAIPVAADEETASETADATLTAIETVTRGAIHNVTYTATCETTDKTTGAATRTAIFAATRTAIFAATRTATAIAVEAATTVSETVDATLTTIEAAAASCYSLAGEFGLSCSRRFLSAYQGGNMWSSYDGYLSAFRDVLGLELPSHEKYKYWEDATKLGGFRVMHEKFCIVSDFPDFIKMDDQNRPHSETGPSHQWSDGWALYHWHGVVVPKEWIENPDSVDPTEVLTCKNAEQRAAGIDIIGWDKMRNNWSRRLKPIQAKEKNNGQQ